MKNYFVIAGTILLAAALVMSVKAFSMPTEVSAKKMVKVLRYEKEGAFDYAVVAKPAYYYNDSPMATAETSPQIPEKFIESIILSYEYSSESVEQEHIRIDAVMESPAAWRKVVNLVPECPANSSISFSLELADFRELADIIERNIGVTATASYELTLKAIVSEGDNAVFTQLLPVKMGKTYIKIGDSLAHTEGARKGSFDYQVKVSDNTLFGAGILAPPKLPDETSDKILGPENAVFTKFIDSMEVSYSYKLTSPVPIVQSQSELIVEAILENPGKWSKTYTLVPPTRESGDFTITFPLDLTKFVDIFDTIQSETGIQVSKRNLMLRATVHTTAQTDAGQINDVYTQSIQTDLKDGILVWSDDLKKKETGYVEAPRVVVEPALLLKLPVFWWRVASSGLAFAILAYFALYFFVFSRRGIDKVEAETRQLLRKHREMIVEVKEWPESTPAEMVVQVETFRDLMKVSQGLLKPLHHKQEKNKHLFWVYDGTNRYEYLPASGAPYRTVLSRVNERLANVPVKTES